LEAKPSSLEFILVDQKVTEVFIERRDLRVWMEGKPRGLEASEDARKCTWARAEEAQAAQN
jgi:hypothetical protein